MQTLSALTAVKPATCPHTPPCPAADAVDHDAALVVEDHHADMGAVKLCNGVWLFDDTGELLPSGICIQPHRPSVHAGAQWDSAVAS